MVILNQGPTFSFLSGLHAMYIAIADRFILSSAILNFALWKIYKVNSELT